MPDLETRSSQICKHQCPTCGAPTREGKSNHFPDADNIVPQTRLDEPRLWQTDDEAGGAIPSSVITRGALCQLIRQILIVSKRSSCWNREMREGAIAVAEFLTTSFDLKVDIPQMNEVPKNSETPRLEHTWPGGAASRNGMVRLTLQPEGGPLTDPLPFWMTPGQTLALISEMSKAAHDALKEQIS